MNRLYSIFSFILAALAICGCSTTVDLNQEQREDIITYLTSSHTPTLLSESAAKTSLENEPAFYSTSGSTTFRYIEDYYDSSRESQTVIKKGSRVSMTFTVYDFEDIATPTIYDVLYTNNQTIIDLITDEATWFNTTWNSDPYTFTVGSGNLVGHVEDMLVGCRNGDVIEFYMTLDEAYGSELIGLSSYEAPLALYCKILDVN